MTKYPDTLPLVDVLKMINQIIAGTFDVKHIAKVVWETIGYALSKFIGELGEALVGAIQSVTTLSVDLMTKADALGPVAKTLLRTLITLLLAL